MKSESDEILELEAALRGDLPSERDAARVRARLTGLGLGIGVTLTSATAAALAGSKSTAPAGFLGFLSALPAGAKVGIATLVTASAVAGPVYYSKASDAPVAPPPQAATQPAERTRTRQAPKPVLEPAPAETALAPTTPPSEVLEEALPREPSPERAARSASTSPLRDAVPAPVAPAAAATLGEETRLIDAALSALRRGDRATATEFIRQHEQRFPDGLLRRERERARAALIEPLENRP